MPRTKTAAAGAACIFEPTELEGFSRSSTNPRLVPRILMTSLKIVVPLVLAVVVAMLFIIQPWGEERPDEVRDASARNSAMEPLVEPESERDASATIARTGSDQGSVISGKLIAAGTGSPVADFPV